MFINWWPLVLISMWFLQWQCGLEFCCELFHPSCIRGQRGSISCIRRHGEGSPRFIWWALHSGMTLAFWHIWINLHGSTLTSDWFIKHEDSKSRIYWSLSRSSRTVIDLTSIESQNPELLNYKKDQRKLWLVIIFRFWWISSFLLCSQYSDVELCFNARFVVSWWVIEFFRKNGRLDQMQSNH